MRSSTKEVVKVTQCGVLQAKDPLCLAERTVWTGLRERKESQARVGAFVIGFCAEYDSMLCSEGITDHFMARRRHG
eukprot:s3140_g4.t1